MNKISNLYPMQPLIIILLANLINRNTEKSLKIPVKLKKKTIHSYVIINKMRYSI